MYSALVFETLLQNCLLGAADWNALCLQDMQCSDACDVRCVRVARSTSAFGGGGCLVIVAQWQSSTRLSRSQTIFPHGREKKFSLHMPIFKVILSMVCRRIVQAQD